MILLAPLYKEIKLGFESPSPIVENFRIFNEKKLDKLTILSTKNEILAKLEKNNS